MGFHLWIDGELAWAQGSYEYRPMGTAVISTSDLFKRRDFSARRRPPRQSAPPVYLGQFASLGHLNQELRRRRKQERAAGRRSTFTTGRAGPMRRKRRPSN